MKQKTFFIFLAFGILLSCKKNNQQPELKPATQKQAQRPSLTGNGGGTITLLNPNIQGALKEMDFGSPSAYFPPAMGGYVNSFSLTLGCNGYTVLNLNEVVLFGSGFPNQIKINGNVFTLDFYYNIQPCINVFKLANISSMEIGADLNDPSTVLTFSYFYFLDPLGNPNNLQQTWEVGESYPFSQFACTRPSAQPSAASPGPNQLRFWVPHIICIPLIFYSESYQFRYRIAGTTSWTETAVYPQSIYMPGVTISGLPAGTYEFEGRNVCTGSIGSWVPGVGAGTGGPSYVVVN